MIECGECGKLILPSDEKVVVQDTAYHARCWDRRQRRRR
jgi:hypothetical protein